jgi:hypothetical protein
VKGEHDCGGGVQHGFRGGVMDVHAAIRGGICSVRFAILAVALLSGCDGSGCRESRPIGLVLVEPGGQITPRHYLEAERIPNARIRIAWAQDLDGVDLEQYVQDFADTETISDDAGRIDFDVCGRTRGLDFVNVSFQPDFRFAVLGVERTVPGPLETLVVEFGESSVIRITAAVESVTGDTIEAALPVGDVLLPVEP